MSQDPVNEHAGRSRDDATMLQPVTSTPATDASEMTRNEVVSDGSREPRSATEVGLEPKTAVSATEENAASTESLTQVAPTPSQTDVPTIVPQQTQPADPQVAETVIQQAESSETQFETPEAKSKARTAGGRRGMLKSFGDYEVLAEIARGGMGVVYRARQTRLNRVVAVKMILQGQLASDGDIQRFYSEAEAAARLEHPGIVPIYEVGEHDGQHYFSMGFVDGESLADRVRRGPLPAREAASLVKDVAEAIEYAHQHGIVHRDLKPGNILLTRDGHPRVTDFGLAKAIEHDSGLTASGQVLGTPSYMPPEQAAGRIREVGPLSDLYSLGAVLYCLLVGRPPFQGVTVMETLKHVVESTPVSPRLLNPSVDRDLETICLKCLEKTPAHRLVSAGELAEELRRYLAGEPIRSRRVNAATRLWRWCKRKPLAAALVASVLVLGVAIAAGFSFAKSASASREYAKLQTEFERTVDNAVLSEEWLKSAENLSTRIAALPKPNEQAAVDYASRITDAFADLIHKELKRPKLSNEQGESLRASISLLKGRAPSLSEDLLKQLEGRLTDWIVDFELMASQSPTPGALPSVEVSEQLKRIFGERRVQVVNGAFVPTFSETSLSTISGKSAKPGHGDNAAEVKYVVAPQAATLQACRDDIELSGVFGSEWRSATEVGLSLNAAAGRGYDFVLRVLDAPTTTVSNEDGAVATTTGTKQFVAEVRRHGVPLLRRPLAADIVPTGPLQLRARRQRGDLEFQIQSFEPIRFSDPFALRADAPGVFAVRWPANVPLQSLSAQHRPRPVATTGLELGDELFDAGQFAEAAEKYRQQMTEADDDAVKQEARYKLGASLMELQRPAEADEVLAPLLANKQSSWSALSGVQMLVSALRRKQSDDADGIIEILSSRHRFEELAVLVPTELRDEILKNYAQSFLSIGGVLQFDAKRLQKIERAAAIDRMLSPDGLGDYVNQLELVRVYRYFGKWPEALAAIEPILRRNRDGTTMRHFCRILRFHGDSKRAIEEIDASLSGRTPMNPPNGANYRALLLLERARANYVLGNIENCEADLRTLRQPVEGEMRENYSSSASAVMLGLLLEDRGHTAAAIEIWKQAYQQARILFDGKGKSYDSSLILALMLGSLCGELQDADANEFMRLVTSGDSGGSTISMATSLITPQSMAEAMREMWRTPRGKRAARDMAFEIVPLRERTRLPVVLLGYTFFRQKAFESVLSDEQDQELWEFLLAGHTNTMESGSLKTSQLMQLALTWKGTTNFVGWGGVAPSLPPEFRARAAFVMGHRFLRLSKPTEAKMFFETALRDAPKDSVLARVAKQDLELLQQDRVRMLVESDVPGVIVNVRRGAESIATVDLRTTLKSEISLPSGVYELEVSGTRQVDARCDAVIIPTEAASASKAIEPQPAATALISLQPIRLQVRLPQVATTTLKLQSQWHEPSSLTQLRGIVPKPALLPGLGRWQIKRRDPYGVIHHLEWTADGASIVIDSSNEVLHVLNATDGHIESAVLGHRWIPNSVQCSPVGTWLAVADFTGTLRLWNLKTRQVAFTRPETFAFAWAPDGKSLVVITSGFVRVLDLMGTELSRFRFERSISGLSLSPDGQRVVLASRELSELAIVDRGENCRWAEPRFIQSKLDGGPGLLSWSPDNQCLVVSSSSAVEVWDTDSWTILNRWKSGSNSSATSVGSRTYWEADSQHFLTMGTGPVALRFDARSADGTAPEQIDVKHSSLGSALSPDFKRFALGANSEIQIVERGGANSKKIDWKPQHAALNVAWSPDGRRLASMIGEQLLLHDVVTEDQSKPLQVGKLLTSHIPGTVQLAQARWSHDGTALAVTNHGGTLSILAPDGTTMAKRVLDVAVAHFDWLRGGQQLVGARHDGKVVLLSRTGDVRAELGQFDQASCLAVSPDSEHVAIGMSDGTVSVVSLKTREKRQIKLRGYIASILWTPDGQNLIAGSEVMHVLNVKTMQSVAESTYLGGTFTELTWLPTRGTVLASLHTGRVIELNLEAVAVRTLIDDRSSVTSMSLHSDQRTVALGTSDGTVELWDLDSGKSLCVMISTQHRGCLILSPTGEPLSLTPGKLDATGKASADELDDLTWIVESESGSQSMLRASEFFARQQAAFDRETLARLKSDSLPREAPAAALEDIGKLNVPEIQEASGLVASRKHAGVFWTISDSGNPANLYALDATGRVLATYRIAGATNSDWESITLDEHARLFIADTGNATRSVVRTIYELAEPDPRAAAESSFSKPIDLTPRRSLTFNAPTPETDFEASFTLGGQLFLPTKVSSGAAHLYALTLPSPSTVVIPQPVSLELKSIGPIPNANWITDAALQPNGKRLALVTYSEAILFDLPEGGIIPSSTTALPSPVARVRFEAPFIEAASFDRDGKLLLLSETGTLHRVSP